MTGRAPTFGEGDPALDRALRELHDAAVRRGEALYLDPSTGLWVQTSAQLLRRGACCGNGCRHCPYPRAEQARAGRATLRPEAKP